jgi:hypothetical protein
MKGFPSDCRGRLVNGQGLEGEIDTCIENLLAANSVIILYRAVHDGISCWPRIDVPPNCLRPRQRLLDFIVRAEAQEGLQVSERHGIFWR